MSLSPDQKAEVRRLAAEVTAIVRSGQVLPGTINKRLQTCGHPNCACHGDPPRPHGPYWHWTRKVAAKTVGRWLSAEQAADYDRWVKNSRRLRELVASLEAIGIAAIESDSRTGRGKARRKAEVEKQKKPRRSAEQ